MMVHAGTLGRQLAPRGQEEEARGAWKGGSGAAPPPRGEPDGSNELCDG